MDSFGKVSSTGLKYAKLCAILSFAFPHFSVAPKFLDLTFKTVSISYHLANFDNDKLTKLGDFGPKCKNVLAPTLQGVVPFSFGR